MSTMLDLGKIMGEYILSEQDKTDIADIIAAMPEWANKINAAINLRLDDTPTQGSANLMTSGAIYNAFNAFTPSKTVIALTAPMTIVSPPLNTELYYSNGGFSANTLAITLPAIASDGDKFSLEFRSTGSAEVYAIIDSFDVEDGGRLLTNGEISNTAYATQIQAVYSAGVWLATITVFVATAGIEETTYGTIIYSGANRGYFASLAGGSDITRSVIVGPNRLESANLLTPTGSAYSFGNLYGMGFNGWNTAEDGSGDSYEENDIAQVESENIPLRLYPQYTPRERDGSFSGAPRMDLFGNPQRTVTLTVAPDWNNFIADYRELKIKVKVYGEIYAFNAGHGSMIQVNGTTIVGPIEDAKVKVSGVSDWVELTRSTANEPFVIDVYFCARPDTNGKHSEFACMVCALRVE